MSFIKNENDYMDEIMPHIEGLRSEYYQALTSSQFRDELEKKWGKQLFDLAEGQLKTFSPEIIPLAQKEKISCHLNIRSL